MTAHHTTQDDQSSTVKRNPVNKHGRIRTRFASIATVAALVAAGLTTSTLAAPAASADPGPIAVSSVSADALPTAQIDGVAWVQTVVGDTVFVGGQFSHARPAGAAPGTDQVTRNNLMSYNLKTGVMTNFAPDLNGQVKALAASPDGKILYVGGSFTKVDGQTRHRLAAFDTATGTGTGTGKLITTWARTPLDATVNAIVATDSTVYVGGLFGKVGDQARPRLAAFQATTGDLTTWAPPADAKVNAMVLTADGGIVVGGAFKNINGVPSYGLGKVSQTDGRTMPWDPSVGPHTVRNAGPQAAITSLSTDGKAVYGTGYDFGADGGGNLEGAFSASPATGTLNWVENCHGDTYGAAPLGGTVYTVSHAHSCETIGGFPESVPREQNMRFSLAFSTEATGTSIHDTWSPQYYYDWLDAPSPSMQHWFPVMNQGTFTGMKQAAWSVAGNDDYVVLGGEFTTVNGVGQEGLVRFAVRSIAPNKSGPEYSGGKFMPTVTGLPGQQAQVSWQANSDEDDATLTYQVTRDGKVVHEARADSTFWNRPVMTFIDSGLTPGSTYKYRLTASDSHGNLVKGDSVNFTEPAVAAANATPPQAIDTVITEPPATAQVSADDTMPLAPIAGPGITSVELPSSR